MKKGINWNNVVKWIYAGFFFALSLFLLFYTWICVISFEYAVWEYLEGGRLITSNAVGAFVVVGFASFITNTIAFLFRPKKPVAIILFVAIIIALILLYVQLGSLSQLVDEDAYQSNFMAGNLADK